MVDAENLPFYLLFSVVMAVLLCGIFVMQVSKQREAGVDEQAQLLVDDIARTCFAALVRQQPTYMLPTDVGGSDYELRVDNRTIVLTIIGGVRKGQSYYSSVNAALEVRSLPNPGGKLFVQGRGDRIVISAEPIEIAPLEIEPPKETAPPEFYSWAKENSFEAVAMAAAYFYALDHHPPVRDGKVLDVIGYRREGDDVLVRLVYRGAEYSRPKEGSWTQTSRTDFEISDLENLDAASGPGDVKLQTTFEGARIYVRPTDDASVYDKYPSANYGDRTSIWVTRLDKLGYVNWGFLKFDLGEAPSAILEAKLYLHCWKLELDEFVAACHEVSDDGWSERTITWNSKPGHGSRLDAVAITGAGWYTWGVTNFVSREFNGDGVVSFCLRGAPEVGYIGRALFDSKEWQNSDRHPYLEITCAPQYVGTGVLMSPAYDAGEVVEWGRISWTSSEPMGTSVKVEISTSNDNLAWSAWQACANGLEAPSPPARFIRYRATLRTDNIYLTPVLHDVTIGHKTLTEEEELATLRVVGGWDNGRVGGVEKAWLVREILRGAENFEFGYNPSVADAFSVGWIRSPSQALAQLRQRTWQMLIMSDERISPTDDAYVEELNPNSNFGNSDILYVGSKRDPYGNPTVVQSYLKFDLSTVSGSLEGAWLRAYVYNRSGAPRITAHSVAHDGWSEKSITWNNRPALGSALQELQIIYYGGWVSWDITRFIRSELAGDGVAGVGLTHSGGSAWFYSKDSYRDGPYLEVAYLVPSGIVVVPFDAACHATAAMTNVATYPTWRFEFEHEGRPIVLHYAMMPWHYGENEPGFIFQSEPRLEPLT